MQYLQFEYEFALTIDFPLWSLRGSIFQRWQSRDATDVTVPLSESMWRTLSHFTPTLQLNIRRAYGMYKPCPLCPQIRTVCYGSQLLGGALSRSPQTSGPSQRLGKSLLLFSAELSHCRTVLRLFDDLSMLAYSRNYGFGHRVRLTFRYCHVFRWETVVSSRLILQPSITQPHASITKTPD